MRWARYVVVGDDALHQALVLLQAQQAAPQQTLNLALLRLQVLVVRRELEIGKLREIIAPNWTCCEGVARPGR